MEVSVWHLPECSTAGEKMGCFANRMRGLMECVSKKSAETLGPKNDGGSGKFHW